MTAKEWTKRVEDQMPFTFTTFGFQDIIADLAALESFCEGLKGTNDDLRGKLTACEKERDLGASMLAKQCDLAREAETELKQAQKKIAEYEAFMKPIRDAYSGNDAVNVEGDTR